MALYYLDESKAPRECRRTDGAFVCRNGGMYEESTSAYGGLCGHCNGTGRLGDPEAHHDLEVVKFTKSARPSYPEGFYYREWMLDGTCAGQWRGPYLTESAALEAARKALREGR